MKYKIEYSRESIRDLDSIFDFMLLQSQDRVHIETFFQNLRESVKILEDYPQAGKELLLNKGVSTGYRYIVFRKYLIFYHICDDSVRISRVISSRRDFMNILFQKENGHL